MMAIRKGSVQEATPPETSIIVPPDELAAYMVDLSIEFANLAARQGWHAGSESLFRAAAEIGGAAGIPAEGKIRAARKRLGCH